MELVTPFDRRRLITSTMDLVKQVHVGQKYGIFDYEMHLHSCYYVAIETQCQDPDIHAALLGHDLLEEKTGLTVEELEERTNARVAHLIQSVTREEEDPYFAYIQEVCEGELATLYIKAIDLLVNMNGLAALNLYDPNPSRDLAKRYAQALQYIETALATRWGIERTSGWGWITYLSHVSAALRRNVEPHI